MDNLTALNLIIGFLSPILIAMINQPSFNSKAKVAVMVGTSIAAGFLTAYFSDAFEATDIIGAILTTAVAAIASYKGIFGPLGLADKITTATSPKASTEAAVRPSESLTETTATDVAAVDSDAPLVPRTRREVKLLRELRKAESNKPSA